MTHFKKIMAVMLAFVLGIVIQKESSMYSIFWSELQAATHIVPRFGDSSPSTSRQAGPCLWEALCAMGQKVRRAYSVYDAP